MGIIKEALNSIDLKIKVRAAMPGHKGKIKVEGSHDVTELTGLDNLQHPEGIIKQAEEAAAKLYGTDQARFLVNGSTGGNLAMIFSFFSEGDQVLIEVARRLQVEAREVDHVARYGGEEFCVLLPHTEHEGALQAAERLREGVCERPITWGNATVPVTISMGLVCANDPRESLQSLLRRADAALYQAKDGGRNMVVSAPTKDDSATPDATQA